MKPPQELAKYLKHATGGVDENALVKMRTLLGWVAKIITLLPQPSRGISVRRSLDGDVWTAGGVDAGARGLNCTVRSDGTTVAVVPSTICGVMPKIGTTPLSSSPTPTLTITGTGTEYIVATITGTYTVTDSILVHPAFAAITSVVLSVSSTEPDEQDLRSDGVHTLLLATFVDAVKTVQNGYGPVAYYLQDSWTEDAEAMLIPLRATV